ncbi:8-amino-7-oxononanoate synthase [Ectothiorhodospiraceae bacterium 2226]|nr:8-amino-7-oxononanoate synthase [Ectothiorhodospiraceae bacterium 2226]
MARALTERAQQGLYRRREVLSGAQGPEVVIGGRRYLNFRSNDYLGLAAHPALRQALAEAAERYGTGAGASHLLGGHSAVHEELETALAAFVGRPRALLFSTGYMANLGTVTALVGRGETVLQDRLNHASLLDAAVLARARLVRYRHADAAALGDAIARAERPALVVTDGVFSMDGDIAPLPALAQAAQAAGAWFMVDDAHGLGVCGSGGEGSVAQHGLTGEAVPLLMGTLGKALGTFGAFVAADEVLIETLIQQARPYVYTTALPPAIAAAALAAVTLVREEPWRRRRLAERVAQFRTEAAAHTLPLLASDTAIQPVPVGDVTRALALGERLRARGVLVGVIRPPTVPPGGARLRVSLSAAHEPEQVSRLVRALADAWAQEGGRAPS